MKLVVTATKPPVLCIVPDSANFNINGTLEVFVIQPNKTEVLAFVLGVVRHYCKMLKLQNCLI